MVFQRWVQQFLLQKQRECLPKAQSELWHKLEKVRYEWQQIKSPVDEKRVHPYLLRIINEYVEEVRKMIKFVKLFVWIHKSFLSETFCCSSGEHGDMSSVENRANGGYKQMWNRCINEVWNPIGKHILEKCVPKFVGDQYRPAERGICQVSY